MRSDRVSFLSVDEVLAIHACVVDAHGGSGGVRDRGLLESALFRPQTGYYDDLIQMAAALFESLLRNHPFVDGNKRVAFVATDAFLRLNGWRLTVEPRAAHAVIVGMLERREHGLADVEAWIRANVRRTGRP